MGGFGSGQCDGRATVEGCCSLVLDVDQIIRPIRRVMRKLGISEIPDGRVLEHSWRAFRWTYGGDAEPWATVGYRIELRSHGGTVWLRYDVDHHSLRTGPQKHRITVERRLARSEACAGGGYARRPGAGCASSTCRTVGRGS